MLQDSFGNNIDQVVGYARGNILSNSSDETMKYHHALKLIKSRAKNNEGENLYVFTGNIRANQLYDTDLELLSEEWVGTALFYSELKEQIILHLDGDINSESAVFNRTSGGIICTILSLTGKNSTVFSFAANNKCHPSVRRGALLTGADFYEIKCVEEFKRISAKKSDLCVVTGVTSELNVLDNDTFIEVLEIAKAKGVNVLVDDAYGARIRTVLYNQPHALNAGADLVITNNDKAAMHGPRAGILAGRKALVTKIMANANKLGMEARTPISLGVYRSLQKYNEKDLLEEVETGEKLYNSLVRRIGRSLVKRTVLGPEINEECLLQYIIENSPKTIHQPNIVPVEVTAAVGAVLLEKYGLITTNSCGMPGAKPSIRLKSNPEILGKFGGEEKFANAVIDSINIVSALIDNTNEMEKLIFGIN